MSNDIIDKSGAWYAYNGNKIGQGRENAKLFLENNEAVCMEIENKVRAALGVSGNNADAAVEGMDED